MGKENGERAPSPAKIPPRAAVLHPYATLPGPPPAGPVAPGVPDHG